MAMLPPEIALRPGIARMGRRYCMLGSLQAEISGCDCVPGRQLFRLFQDFIEVSVEKTGVDIATLHRWVRDQIFEKSDVARQTENLAAGQSVLQALKGGFCRKRSNISSLSIHWFLRRLTGCMSGVISASSGAVS